MVIASWRDPAEAIMMATAVVGIAAGSGKRILSPSSSYYCHADSGDRLGSAAASNKNSNCYKASAIPAVAKKSTSYSSRNHTYISSSRLSQSQPPPSSPMGTVSGGGAAAAAEATFGHNVLMHDLEEQTSDLEYSLEALLLLQKSMLESQWNLCFDGNQNKESVRKKVPVTCSGTSARQRRIGTRRRKLRVKQLHQASPGQSIPKLLRSAISPELMRNRLNGYVKGVVSDSLLTHSEVVHLSKKIKTGLSIEEHKSRLNDRLGVEPSDDQLATSLKISRAELQSKLIECSLAREKLAMSNVRLVMSIAQRYDNMGAEMSDLVQGGLIGLLRGIEKFDSSKGFKISTYVYWWIRQGVSRALVENSRTLRLPVHLHERLGLIRNAKARLAEKGITPTVGRIAECLNMSEKKVRNATEAMGRVFSLDRDAFPSLNGLPGDTHHSYIADNRIENNPWHGVDEWALKDEVNKLIHMALGEREREIIRLYYGLDNEYLTWEDISKRVGLSRERVRQVGLVALQKLKHVARKRKMEAMLVKH
ncbi:hypothetical protein SAY86_019449 [Trapa natans]|uniref:RNA polymerase sigma-70 domain-containing protein n=1 Tax=Trapa natans TaxID=22666 RepID=A0AAN7LLU9_TRANT|nr:hypothetical protein SAY86_019449 [Trapa natans]